MELIPSGTKIDFVRYRNQAILGSWALILIGLGVAFVKGGPLLGIDFSGGSLVHVRFQQAKDIQAVRNALDNAELGAVSIQSVQGAQSEFLIRVPMSAGEVEADTKKVMDQLNKVFGGDGMEVLRVESVGPVVGRELRTKAILSVLFATLMMGVYIWLRFEWRFGVGAALALLHDVLITVVTLIVFNYEFDLTIVAALLTIVGFSVNDTVIVSDRIRENMRKDRRSALAEIINRSINETLSRTVLTTGTALLVILALYILGGTVIHGFAFALLIGFFVGTYSSIFIASPVVLFFEGNRRAAQSRGGTAASRGTPAGRGAATGRGTAPGRRA